MKFIGIVFLLLSSNVFASGYMSGCFSHYSQIVKEDFGVSVAGLCLNQEWNNFNLELSATTPVFDNDIGQNGSNDTQRLWDRGDLIGGAKIEYKFWRW